jgi:small subunit ribosomal protein S17
MKIFSGVVISKHMQKTATVSVDRVVVHPVYKKRYKRSKKYHVHDEMGSNVGDIVKFVASKPYSKSKKWKIIEVEGVKSDKKITKKSLSKKKGKQL